MSKGNAVTVSQVLHHETKQVVAIEIVANDGQTYFVCPPGHLLDGVRVYPFPCDSNGNRLERVEIARME